MRSTLPWWMAPLLGFAIGFALMGTLQAFAAEECPADRPHRLVVQMPGSMTRTLLSCTRLVCPEGAEKCRMISHDDCNTTTYHPGSVIGMCLTDDELRAARVSK